MTIVKLIGLNLWTGSRCGPVVGFCEHGDGLSGSTEAGCAVTDSLYPHTFQGRPHAMQLVVDECIHYERG
jgi:hypothetical protein